MLTKGKCPGIIDMCRNCEPRACARALIGKCQCSLYIIEPAIVIKNVSHRVPISKTNVDSDFL